jgi:hypothetical protein
MKQSAAVLTMLTILVVIGSPAGLASPPVPDPQQKGPDKQKQQTGSSLTGCVDEQEGHYVLVDDRTLSPIADLVADGFPTEAFAKHVGHKVTVRGTSSSGSARPVLKARIIETVSDTCAPQSPAQGKQ